MPGKRGPHKPTCACPACKSHRARVEREHADTRLGPEETQPLTDRERPGLALPLAEVNPSGPKRKAISLQERYTKSQGLTSARKGTKRWGVHPTPPETVIRPDCMVVEEGGTRRNRIAQWLEMRTKDPSITMRQASLNLGLSQGYIAATVAQAVKEGWLRFDDPLERIEHQIIPRTLDNLTQMLAEGNEKVTIETAKGVVFPIYRESKGVTEAPQTILALKIEGIPQGEGPMIFKGEVVGQGRAVLPLPKETDDL